MSAQESIEIYIKRWSIENDIPRNAFVVGVGIDAGILPFNGAESGAEPIWVVFGGGVAVRGDERTFVRRICNVSYITERFATWFSDFRY